MKKTLVYIMLLALAVAALCSACQGVPMPPAPSEPQVQEPVGQGEAEPEQVTPAKNSTNFPTSFDAVDLNGDDVDESIFDGYELTMINIWATYCDPCIMEMEYLGEMSAEMPEGTQLIGLAGDVLTPETFDLAVSIVEKTGANFPHLVPDKALYDYLFYNVMGYPTTIFVDSEGNMVGGQLLGMRSREMYEGALKLTLEELRNQTGAAQ